MVARMATSLVTLTLIACSLQAGEPSDTREDAVQNGAPTTYPVVSVSAPGSYAECNGVSLSSRYVLSTTSCVPADATTVTVCDLATSRCVQGFSERLLADKETIVLRLATDLAMPWYPALPATPPVAGQTVTCASAHGWNTAGPAQGQFTLGAVGATLSNRVEVTPVGYVDTGRPFAGAHFDGDLGASCFVGSTLSGIVVKLGTVGGFEAPANAADIRGAEACGTRQCGYVKAGALFFDCGRCLGTCTADGVCNRYIPIPM